MCNTIYTDDNGMMFKYVYTYTHEGVKYGFDLWAKSMIDAEARLESISKTGVVDGKLIKEI